MYVVYRWLFPLLWGAWALYWLAASLGVKPVRQKEGLASRMAHIIPLVLSLVLLNTPRLAGSLLREQILPQSATQFWCGAALTVVGLGLSIAARVHLGGNWSGTVTVKQDHTLIRSGPYRLVRHPIYTGILAALLGSIMALDEWRGVVALLLVLAAFLRKMWTEERFMLAEFGHAYRQYRREVPALIPRLF